MIETQNNWAAGKILFSDIDGTFLSSDADAVEKNCQAVKAFTAAGGLFSFSTGRVNPGHAIPNYRELVNAPLVLANGALAKKPDGGILFEEILDTDVAHGIEDALMRAYPRDTGHERHINEESGEFYKVVFYTKAENIAGMHRIVYDLYGDTLEYSCSCPTLIEFTRKGVSKGNAILKIKEHYRQQGLPLTVYAIGDYQNDLDMLQKADVAACPDNASDEVKEICKYILCRNDCGAVADFINQIREDELS